jgi:anti-sigma-K factor RskA
MSEDVHALAGPYALGALSGDTERQAFEEHLSRCEVCAEEVGGLLATSAVLGRAVALPAPAGLRDRVFDEIGRTAQESAAIPITRARTIGRRRFTIAVVAAASAAVLAGSGALVYETKQSSDRAAATDRAIARIMSATDARANTVPVTSGGTALLVSSPEQRRAVLVVHYLQALPGSKTYELWMMSGNAARPAGLLRPDHLGHYGARLLTVSGGADRVGLTVEPAGGSPQPTTAPIAVLTI